MKMYLALTLLFTVNFIHAQEKGTGLIFDPPSLRSIPYKAKLTTASYSSMPASASLEKYCPTPGDQGQFGTCVAFATAYHLRSILFTKAQNESGVAKSAVINPNTTVFSPSFVYEQIKNESDKNCQEGTNPVDAFELMLNIGTATITTQPYACGMPIKREAIKESEAFKISDYQILYSVDETDRDIKINATKKAISEGYPCMLGFIVAKSFYKINGDVWRQQDTDDGPSGKHGRHAMCVVSYDDNKYGGAFRVLNSWGTSWADKGYVWIPYSDFAKYSLMVIQAYGPIVVKPDPKPQPKPIDPVIVAQLKGTVSFKTNVGEVMDASKVLTRNLVVADDIPVYKEELVAYKMERSYTSGTRFRFFITTNTECYIYAFATDLSGKVNKILPFADNMSPHIGKNSTVAFPSETKVVKMDDNPGTDYLLILYSKVPLNSAEMLTNMNAAKGGLSTKVKAALGDKLILPSNILYQTNSIGFEVKNNAQGTVVPLMAELTHL